MSIKFNNKSFTLIKKKIIMKKYKLHLTLQTENNQKLEIRK